MEEIDFAEWLEKKRAKKGWSRAELARQIRISAPQVTRVLNREQGPGDDFIAGTAQAFGLDIDFVYGIAKRIHSHKDSDEDFNELKNLFLKMTDDEQEEFLAAGRLKVKLRQRRGTIGDTSKARTASV